MSPNSDPGNGSPTASVPVGTELVVMSRATDATVRSVVNVAHDRGVSVMGDVLGADDYAADTRRMESLGCRCGDHTPWLR